MTRVVLKIFFVSLLCLCGGCGYLAAPQRNTTELTLSGSAGTVSTSDELGVATPTDIAGACKVDSIWGSPDPESCAAALRSLDAADREQELVRFCTTNADAAYNKLCSEVVKNLTPSDSPRSPWNRNMARSGHGRRGYRGSSTTNVQNNYLYDGIP